MYQCANRSLIDCAGIHAGLGFFVFYTRELPLFLLPRGGGGDEHILRTAILAHAELRVED